MLETELLRDRLQSKRQVNAQSPKSVCVCVCVCVCVLVYATLCGPNVPTRIVKPEIVDIAVPTRGIVFFFK